jgi:hypothetical protein
MMLRFVILTHDHPYWHWDFMLEDSAGLKTWRLDADPTPGVVLQATALPVHRLQYLDYEGPVSGGRGEVHRWDSGTYEVLEEHDELLVVMLAGERLNGQVNIFKSDEGESFCFTPETGGIDQQQV